MEAGKNNLIAGAAVLILAAIYGFYLGLTIEHVMVDDAYVMALPRLLMKGAHSHGMLIALYNLVMGILLNKLVLTDRQKNTASVLALFAFLLPLGLLLRGLTEGAKTFAPIAGIGSICFILSLVMILKGLLAKD